MPKKQGLRSAKRKVDRLKITNEAQWRKWRDADITGSNIGAIFALHPYETIYGLHARVTGVPIPEAKDTSVLARGREWQEFVGRNVQRAHRTWKLRPCNYYLRDPALKLGGTPDFFCKTDDKPKPRRGIVEAKTVASLQFRTHWANGPPPWIVLQALTYAMLDRADFALIAALEIKTWGPPQLHEFMVPRHAEAEQRIVDGVKRFWADIEAGIPPRPDFTRDGALIMAMHNVSKGKLIDLTADNRLPELLAEREKLKATEAEGKEAEEKRKALDAEIISKMGDAEFCIANGWKIKAQEIHRKEYVVEATDYRLVRVTRTEEQKPTNTDVANVA